MTLTLTGTAFTLFFVVGFLPSDPEEKPESTRLLPLTLVTLPEANPKLPNPRGALPLPGVDRRSHRRPRRALASARRREPPEPPGRGPPATAESAAAESSGARALSGLAAEMVTDLAVIVPFSDVPGHGDALAHLD